MPIVIRVNPRSCNALKVKTHQLIQLINIISNLIFHCNNCYTNRAFVTIRESTAAAPSSCLLNAKFTFKETSRTNHFRTDSQANEYFTTLSLTVFTQRNFVADFLQAKCDVRRKTAVLRF